MSEYFNILYYDTPEDAKWPVGQEPEEAWYCPDGVYSYTKNNRRIVLHNPEKLKCRKIEASDLANALFLFTSTQGKCYVVAVQDERLNNPSVAIA